MQWIVKNLYGFGDRWPLHFHLHLLLPGFSEKTNPFSIQTGVSDIRTREAYNRTPCFYNCYERLRECLAEASASETQRPTTPSPDKF